MCTNEISRILCSSRNIDNLSPGCRFLCAFNKHITAQTNANQFKYNLLILGSFEIESLGDIITIQPRGRSFESFFFIKQRVAFDAIRGDVSEETFVLLKAKIDGRSISCGKEERKNPVFSKEQGWYVSS